MPRSGVKSSPVPLEALTRELPPVTRAAFAELTSLIRSTIPEATEKVNLGWKSLNFSHPAVGYFCGLFPLQDRIVIAFEFGVLLADPDRILDTRSCSKQVRYMRILSHHKIPRPALKRLLRAAISLPADRSTRIALVRSGARPVRMPGTKRRTPS